MGVIEAVYDAEIDKYVPSNSYCVIRVRGAGGLGHWKLRQTAKSGGDASDQLLAPQWAEEFVVLGVCLDSKVIIDVWDTPVEQPTGGRGVSDGDVFLGKVSFMLEELISVPAPEWCAFRMNALHSTYSHYLAYANDVVISAILHMCSTRE